MKKSILLSILALAVSTGPSFGLGVIVLDNYNTTGPFVTYGGAGIPANGVSGTQGTVGTGLLQGWTVGLYYALGNVTGSIQSDPTGQANPTTLGGGLTLATGLGSSTTFDSAASPQPGAFLSSFAFGVPGTASTGGETVTLMVVAYDTAGGSYANATYRGHSAAFTMTTAANTQVVPNSIGAFMPGFSIPAPEPSEFSLAGLFAAMALVIRRHRNNLVPVSISNNKSNQH